MVTDCDVMSYVMFPKVLDEYLEFKSKFGPVDKLDTRSFLVGPKIAESLNVSCVIGICFANDTIPSQIVSNHRIFSQIEIEKGKTLHVKVLAIGEIKRGEREVFIELNGQLRSIFVKDKASANDPNVKSQPKAVKGIKGSIGAPMPGTVIDIKAKVGDMVKKGDPLVVLSAMKMETVVKSPVDGKVLKVAIQNGQKLEGDDLLFDIDA